MMGAATSKTEVVVGERLNLLEEILERSGQDVPAELLDLDAFLGQSPLFAALTPDARRELAAKARFRLATAGETLIQEGSQGDTFAIIKRGRLAVDANFEGQSRHLATLGPGAIVGEVAVLKGTPRTASVTAREDAELWEFSRDDVRPFLERFPQVRGELEKLIEARTEQAIEIFLGRES